MNNLISNQEKMIIFMRDCNFKHKLNEKLKSKVHFFILSLEFKKLPIIKAQLYSIRYRSTIT
jgi:predicted house-cleaning noncanonical NTP pyrophosphatase (MazG superfamily)